jgi:hypothetical protein
MLRLTPMTVDWITLAIQGMMIVWLLARRLD